MQHPNTKHITNGEGMPNDMQTGIRADAKWTEPTDSELHQAWTN